MKARILAYVLPAVILAAIDLAEAQQQVNTACSEYLFKPYPSIFQPAIYWNNLGFRTLLNRSVYYLAKKLLDHTNQGLVIGREDKLEMIAQSRTDDVDWYLLFPSRKF